MRRKCPQQTFTMMNKNYRPMPTRLWPFLCLFSTQFHIGLTLVMWFYFLIFTIPRLDEILLNQMGRTMFLKKNNVILYKKRPLIKKNQRRCHTYIVQIVIESASITNRDFLLSDLSPQGGFLCLTIITFLAFMFGTCLWKKYNQK